MSDNSEKTAQAAPAEQQFNVLKIYISDLSLEAPHARELFSGDTEWKPQINLQINTETHSIGDGVYEVLLKLTVTATIAEKTAYLVEVKQSGIFKVCGFDKTVLDQLLNCHCPNTLFPFVREAIAGLVSKAGFPQLLLDPIDFNALYAQHMAKAKQSAPAPDTQQ